jgi:hypothetical protein
MQRRRSGTDITTKNQARYFNPTLPPQWLLQPYLQRTSLAWCVLFVTREVGVILIDLFRVSWLAVFSILSFNLVRIHSSLLILHNISRTTR